RPASDACHGSRALRPDLNHLRVPPAQSGTWRGAVYSTAALLVVLLLYLPLVEGGASLAIDGASSLAQVLDPTGGTSTLIGLFIQALILSLVVFFGLALAGLLLVVAVSRLLSPFVLPVVVYPLYGFLDVVHRAIARIGRLRFFTFAF